MMTPCELFAEIADRITMVCKQPYRTEPVTEDEWDKIRDSIITLKVAQESHDGRSQASREA